MTSIELKNYIFEHKEITHILEDLGCRQITFHPNKDYFSATQPDKYADNKMGVIIRNNSYLNYYSYSRGIDIDEKQDIFNLIQTAKNIKFVDAIKYVHKLLGLEFQYNPKKKESDKPKFDPLAIFKRVTSKRKIFDTGEIRFLDENILNDFYQGEHINFFRDGVMPWSAKKFGLCYSYRYKRQIIPIRYWLNGKLMGYNARTTVENYDLFDIDKYFILPGMNKTANLYGLWENMNDIEKAKYVVIYEAEKSVLKRDSLNDSTGVAISGHSISDEQVRILLSLDVHEIIIAMDKDVSLDEVRHLCEKLYCKKKRKISYIYDKWGLLGEQDSPADMPNKIYQFLFKHRIIYDDIEHRKYLQSLERKVKCWKEK